MPILKVLVNQKGEVIGTERPDVGASGSGAPMSVTLVARPGQRVVQINVDDDMVSLQPNELHRAIKSKHGKQLKG